MKTPRHLLTVVGLALAMFPSSSAFASTDRTRTHLESDSTAAAMYPAVAQFAKPAGAFDTAPAHRPPMLAIGAEPPDSAIASYAASDFAIRLASSSGLAQCNCQAEQDAVSAAIRALNAAYRRRARAYTTFQAASAAAIATCVLFPPGCRAAVLAVTMARQALASAQEAVRAAKAALAAAQAAFDACIARVKVDPACQPGEVSGDENDAIASLSPTGAFGRRNSALAVA